MARRESGERARAGVSKRRAGSGETAKEVIKAGSLRDRLPPCLFTADGCDAREKKRRAYHIMVSIRQLDKLKAHSTFQLSEFARRVEKRVEG